MGRASFYGGYSMPKFKVGVRRECVEFTEVEVTARNRTHARYVAVKNVNAQLEAGKDIEWNGAEDCEYKISAKNIDVEPVNAKAAV